MLTRDAGGEDRPARGPGFDQPDGEADGGLGGRDAPARGHQQQGTVKARTYQLVLELRKIPADQRLKIRIRAGGGEALVFAHFRRDLAGQRHRDLRQPPGNCLAHPPLVIRIGEAVQESDRHRLDAACGECLDRASDARVIEREEHFAVRIDPLADRQAQPSGHERRRQIHVEIVLFEAVFVADFDHVTEAFGREKGSSGALALDQRVGGKRGPMND